MPQKKQPAPPLTPEQAAISILGHTPVPLPGLAQPAEITHLSYSGLTTYLECPKKYELSYLMGAPKQGAVWFVGGKAVHSMTELWDRARLAGAAFDMRAAWRDVFANQVEEDKANDPNVAGWRKAGKSAANSEGETLNHWYQVLGPKLVDAYIGWRQRTPWRIWTTPDGKDAIEMDVSGSLPGMGDLSYKGFVDRVFEEDSGRLHVVDLKTGTRKPESPVQFGVYKAAIENKYCVPVYEGAAFMNRRGFLAGPYLLGLYTPAYVGKLFAQVHTAIKAGAFPAKVGRHCSLCDVASSCYANSGPLAATYDRDHPDREEAPY